MSSVSAPVSNSHLVFGDFLESLRLHGFTIGIGHYLRLQKLLARVGPECRPHELKTLLCPIFATDEREQARFYEEFDRYFDFDEPSVEAVPAPIERSGGEVAMATPGPVQVASAKGPNSRVLVVVLSLLGIVLLVAVVSLLMRSAPDPPIDFPTPTPTPEVVASPTPTPFTMFFDNLELSTLLRILVALLPLLLFGLYELFRRLRRRQRGRQQHDREQPSIPIGFRTSLAEVYDPDSIARLARLLRTRQRSGALQLDIGASIAATVKALGFLSLREKSTSQPPEYLVLIDRAAFRDHQARLFYELARKLYGESVFLTCYFFEGDPRVSFMSPFVSVEATPVVRSAEAQQKLEEEAKRAQRGATIEDLHELYPGHRLIIFSEGEDLVDPVTLQTVDWIKSFAHWQERAILTPRPRSLWDAHEFALRQQFVVMPATLSGLELVAESFAIREPVSIPENLRGDKSQPPHDVDSVEGLRELRLYLGEETFQWLCACAVHPQLQWDLTICLGLQFSTKENLFTEEKLLRLFSLPWFRVGAIPDATREKLVSELSAGSEAKVRRTIADLMARAVAMESVPEGAEVVRVPLPQEFAGTVSDQLFNRIRSVRDVAFKRFLQPQPFVLFFKRVLPNWLQRLLFTPFGMRLGTRMALALLVSFLLWAAFPTLVSAFDFGLPANNMNTNVNVNVNYNANINNYNTYPNDNVNTNANGSPTPIPSPRASVSPSPRINPTPRPTPSPSAGLNPRNGILVFRLNRSSIKLGERVILTFAVFGASEITIQPEDGEIAEWNKRFAAVTGRSQDQSGTATIQPPHTTTYTIRALVYTGLDRSLQPQTRQVTVTVDDGGQDGPCRPNSTNLKALKRDENTVNVSVHRACTLDGQESWTMMVNIRSRQAILGGFQYSTKSADEIEALRTIASSGLNTAATSVMLRDIYDAMLKDDRQGASAATQRMLRLVR